MNIVAISVAPCEICGKKRGHLIEKYNGLVPVYCKCDLWDKEKKLANPCAIFCDGGIYGPRPIWKPISDHKEEDGVRRYTSHLAGPSVW